MARTKDQSFVNRYLNQYQRNQQAAVSAGQQAASSAANSGVSTMTQAAQNTKIPSLYDYAPDLMEMVVDQQEAQIKAQQAAAKAAQKEAENAKREAENAKKEAQKEAEEKYKAQKKAAEETMTPTAPAQKTSRYPKTESPLSYKDSISQYTSATKSAQEYADQRKALEKERDQLASKIDWGKEEVTGFQSTDGRRYSQLNTQINALKLRESAAQEKADTAMAAVKSAIKELPDDERIAIYLDPSYKLSKDEEEDAKALGEQLVAQANKMGVNAFGTDPETRQQAQEIRSQGQRLISKTSNVQAIASGAINALFPFLNNALQPVEQWYADATGIDYDPETDSTQAIMQGLQTQSPIANTAGVLGGTLAEYAAGSALMRSIPGVNTGLQKAGQAIGNTRVAQALTNIPILGRAFTPAAITDILGDQAVDTVLDTGVGAARSAMQGEDATQIAQDAAASFGGNLAANIVSAGVLGTASDWLAQRRAARQAANAAQDAPLPALDDAARQTAETVQEAPASVVDDAVPSVSTYQNVDGDAVPFPSDSDYIPMNQQYIPTDEDYAIPSIDRAEAITGKGNQSTYTRQLRNLYDMRANGAISESSYNSAVDEIANNIVKEQQFRVRESDRTYRNALADLKQTKIYVPKDIADDLLYRSGAENLTEFNKKYGTQLTRTTDGARQSIDTAFAAGSDFGVYTPGYEDDPAGALIELINRAKAEGTVSFDSQAYQDAVQSVKNSIYEGGNSRYVQPADMPDAPTESYIPEQAYVPTLEEQAFADNLPPQSIGAMRHDPTSYSSMQNTYGTIAPGENPARVVDVPVSTNGTDRVGAGIRTIMEAPQTSDELVQMFEDGVRDGLFSHNVSKDADALDSAVAFVKESGYKDALNSWDSMIKKGQKMSKADIIQGQLLYSLAAQNGDTETAMRLAGDLTRIATESGQNLQAQRMLKRMTPEGRLYYAEKTVESLNKDLKKQFGSEFKDIVLDQNLVQNLLNANTDQAQREAMNAIYQNVADQMPATWAGRWNAWRYLSMLSNPATHVRNVVSNAVNVPARKLKNIIGAGIERVVLKEGDRTKAVLNPLDSADQSLVQFAKSDIENVMDELTGAQKYSDKSAIMQLADPFKINGTWGTAADSNAIASGARKAADAVTSGLSKLYKTNSWALGAEDMLFKKSAYVDSLAQYLKANNIDPATATVKQLDKARKYAVEEALRATYTEYNSLANAISQLEKKNLGTKVFLGGTIPFKSTPMNIVRRGVRYSPVGLAESLTKGFYDLRKGNINANQLIDNISQGLSGTSIFALGAFMGYMGWINGVSPENQKEEAWRSSQGWQNYSINLPGGGTYTIDWGGPSAMALLAGVETAKAMEQDGIGFNEFVSGLGNITEPMFDTTMLSGINSAIQSATYAGSNPVTAMASQAVTNYVNQAVPSLFGVVARAADPVRRTTYSGDDGAFGAIDKTLQRTENKVPGLSSENQPYIDVWGREQENPGGSFLGRLAYGMLSPGYYSPDRSTAADDLVGDLYAETGDSGVLPGLYPSSITVNGEKIRLSPEDYTAAKQTKGQASLEMLESLNGLSQYDDLSPDLQQKVVSGVYSTASELARLQAVPSLMEEYQKHVDENDLNKTEWFVYKYQTEGADAVVPYLVADKLVSNVGGDKNAKGNTIPGSAKKNKIAVLMENGFTQVEAEEFLDGIG